VWLWKGDGWKTDEKMARREHRVVIWVSGHRCRRTRVEHGLYLTEQGRELLHWLRLRQRRGGLTFRIERLKGDVFFLQRFVPWGCRRTSQLCFTDDETEGRNRK